MIKPLNTKLNLKRFTWLFITAGLIDFISPCLAQAQTNNGAYTTGNANPTASVNTSTTGGTNINYQTNNQWSNEQGFGPGIFCRSPTFYMGASTGQNMGSIIDSTNAETNSYTGNYGGNVGILVPFGSSINQDCKELVKQIVLDRRISNQISMIRACASLDREGIKIDPEKFPLLAICVNTPKQEANPLKKVEKMPTAIPMTKQMSIDKKT